MSFDPILGQYVRLRKARVTHRCEIGGGHDINPGDTYFYGVTLPGVGSYRVYDDWEQDEWEFTTIKACVPCYNNAMAGH